MCHDTESVPQVNEILEVVLWFDSSKERAIFDPATITNKPDVSVL